MEECISVFDMLKIGVGPSSSHTLGPWRAAERFLSELQKENKLDTTSSIRVDLYGSLSLTGKGHATDLAVMLGLSNQNPETIPVENIKKITDQILNDKTIHLGGIIEIGFDPQKAIVFNKNFLPFHSNGIKFTAFFNEKDQYEATYYSIGGGFVVKETTVEWQKHYAEDMGKSKEEIAKINKPKQDISVVADGVLVVK